jgi:hypothetical protein
VENKYFHNHLCGKENSRPREDTLLIRTANLLTLSVYH